MRAVKKRPKALIDALAGCVQGSTQIDGEIN
jgi:hypothetical protein